MTTPAAPDYLIESLPGFAPTVGHLVSMLQYTRGTMLREVQELGMAELDFLLDDQANSIGALLEHVASVEEFYQELCFGAAFEPRDDPRRSVAAHLGDGGRTTIRGHGLPHYLQRLDAVRAFTLAELAKRDDAWLFERHGRPRGGEVNNYWCLFHVAEDELSHRGQVRLIKRRLPV